jgi:hypothetical protein
MTQLSGQESRVGTTRPTPLPERVGAYVRTCSGPLWRRYRLKDMTEQFDAKAAEIRAMFSNQLEPKRTAEIRERMLAAGLPI